MIQIPLDVFTHFLDMIASGKLPRWSNSGHSEPIPTSLASLVLDLLCPAVWSLLIVGKGFMDCESLVGSAGSVCGSRESLWNQVAEARTPKAELS